MTPCPASYPISSGIRDCCTSEHTSQKVVSEFLPCFLGDAENKSEVTGGLIKIIINQVIHLDKVVAVKPPHPHSPPFFQAQPAP